MAQAWGSQSGWDHVLYGFSPDIVLPAYGLRLYQPPTHQSTNESKQNHFKTQLLTNLIAKLDDMQNPGAWLEAQ